MWHLKTKPFKVQEEALRRAEGQQGYGWFMEMGLGKTSTALNEFISLLIQDRVNGMFVVCPNTVKSSWLDEYNKNELKNAGIELAIWPDKFEKMPKMGIFVMNYESTITDRGQKAIEEFFTNRKVYMVADESHRIKNYKAATTKVALVIKKEAAITRALTGSPMTLNVMDYYSQLRFIGQLSGMNPIAFRATFARTGGYMGKQIIGVLNKDVLAGILAKCSFEALKKDWRSDLPPKSYTIRELELTNEMKNHYKEMRDEFITVVDDEAVTAKMVISQMMKLQQISSGFIMKDGVTFPIVSPDKIPKMIEIQDVIESVKGPVIVFAQYTSSIRLLRGALGDSFKTDPAYIVGGMKTEEVVEQKRRFNSGETKIIVCQTQTGSLGHTLLGPDDNQCCTTIFYENNYVLGDRIQAEDRNHRHGQFSDNVLYVDFISSEIERKVISSLQRKMDVIKSIREAAKEARHGNARIVKQS